MIVLLFLDHRGSYDGGRLPGLPQIPGENFWYKLWSWKVCWIATNWMVACIERFQNLFTILTTQSSVWIIFHPSWSFLRLQIYVQNRNFIRIFPVFVDEKWFYGKSVAFQPTILFCLKFIWLSCSAYYFKKFFFKDEDPQYLDMKGLFLFFLSWKSDSRLAFWFVKFQFRCCVHLGCPQALPNIHDRDGNSSIFKLSCFTAFTK